MKQLSGAGRLEVPDDFDTDSTDRIRVAAAKFSTSKPTAWRSFAAAWNGVAWRFRATDEFSREFIEAIAVGDMPPPEDRYKQERSLFAFAGAALSAIECFYFAAYCLGSLTRSDAFPMNDDDDLHFRPGDVAKAFKKIYSTHRITAVLRATLKSREFAQLANLRNVLAHRGTLPRAAVMPTSNEKPAAFVPSNPKSRSSDWRFDQRIDSNFTQSLRDWLGKSLADLLSAMADFAQSQIAIE